MGEEVSEEIKLVDFGRRNVLSMRQNLAGKIMELEKDALYRKYKDRVGEIISAEVYQIWKREILLVDDDDNELIMPRDQQIPGDFFRKGDAVRAVVAEVDIRNNNPRIILSRTAPEFLSRLFEQEVPEIYDGLITIKKGGARPRRPCQGGRGILRRPRGSSRRLCGHERIPHPWHCAGIEEREHRRHQLHGQRAIADRTRLESRQDFIHHHQRENAPKCTSSLTKYLLAIGKGGHNIKLAGRLTGYEIDVYREGETEIDDVELKEFKDEIDAWIIEELEKIGCDTARSVLNLTVEDLANRTDLEIET